MAMTEYINNWYMKKAGSTQWLKCGRFPVSVYQTLINNGLIEDPYYRENEKKARDICNDDYYFNGCFTASEQMLAFDRCVLTFYGIDTISEIYVNNIYIASTDNMHRTYRFDVKHALKKGENTISVAFSSPIEYMKHSQQMRPLYGVDTTIPGYSHLRKAHYMSGWDWGPQLPDMGIWRPVTLTGVSFGTINSFYAQQSFNDDFSGLVLTVNSNITLLTDEKLSLTASLQTADGRTFTQSCDAAVDTSFSFSVDNPPMWYPKGYGDQNLNKLTLTLKKNDETIDVKEENIGFRILTVNRNNTTSKFCFICNGIEIFAMGANYVPQDQIIPYISEDKISSLLNNCIEANYNTLRIWGGGYYPSDFFLNECDRLGIILWQDFMFACSAYILSIDFLPTMTAEITDNVIRMRNHACLGLWCGNNEMESMWEGWGIREDAEAKNDYIEIFENIIPSILRKYDPNRFYWPSSPSSGGNCFPDSDGVFVNSSSNTKGDQHYWDVWHNFKPLEDFRKYLHPFCSEYGFESLPSIKTIRSFTETDDRNLCSPVMENHQKCVAGNEKLLYYIAQMCRYPDSFEKLIYASQFVQSDAIRSDVEHMRRHRGKCMGSLYWQLNDSNPVISWSGIDYYGRWKPLHYSAKKFYAPILISCNESNVKNVIINVCNETRTAQAGTIFWSLRKNDGTVCAMGQVNTVIAPLKAEDIVHLDLEHYIDTDEKIRSTYLEFSFNNENGTVSSGTVLFVRPKSFEFLRPEIKISIDENDENFILTLSADCFVKSLWLDLMNADCIFSDNFFDLHSGEKTTVTVKKSGLSSPLEKDVFEAELTYMCCNMLNLIK